MTVSLEKTGAGFRVCVENPGPVLEAEAFDKLKARSEGLAAEPSEGLGLGLTICRGIADSHGMTLRFESRPEGGVRAVIEMDAADPETVDAEIFEK